MGLGHFSIAAFPRSRSLVPVFLAFENIPLLRSSVVRVFSLDPEEQAGSPQALLNPSLLAKYAIAITPRTPANAASMPPTILVLLLLLPSCIPSPNIFCCKGCVGEKEIEGAAVGEADGLAEGAIEIVGPDDGAFEGLNIME